MGKRGRPPTRPSPERVMTEEDWKAFYLVMHLAEQVAVHGKKALDSFVRAMVSMTAHG